MAATVIDSTLFGDVFGDAKMRAVFDDKNTVQCYLNVETALATVQARLGLIPQESADEIKQKAHIENIDFVNLRRQTNLVGYPILPLVRELISTCRGNLGQYCHWGATTQDIMDTASVLQIRDALNLVELRLKKVGAILHQLAHKYQVTPMAGRTHLQHAVPISFGYKVAVWLSAIPRHLKRLEEFRPRVLTGQFGGAAGTLASLGKDGLAVQKALMDELGLFQPSITWHVVRDNIVEVTNWLGLITGTLSKIATDVMFMMQTEVDEVREPFIEGRGASSTMPNKANPISCERITAIGKSVRQLVVMMLDAMVQDHERATGPWHLEWFSISQAFILTAGALREAEFMLEGLQIYPEKMLDNLLSTHGLIAAEAVMMALSKQMGRTIAHDVVYDACRQALTEKRPLVDILKENKQITENVDNKTLDDLADPTNYLGSAKDMILTLLKESKNFL